MNLRDLTTEGEQIGFVDPEPVSDLTDRFRSHLLGNLNVTEHGDIPPELQVLHALDSFYHFANKLQVFNNLQRRVASGRNYSLWRVFAILLLSSA